VRQRYNEALRYQEPKDPVGCNWKDVSNSKCGPEDMFPLF